MVGWPIAHSLSPLIHNAWIEALQLDGVYRAYAVEPEGDAFEKLVWRLLNQGCVGLNITAPFKERAFSMALDRSHLNALGNANLLMLEEHDVIDVLTAYNTDQMGLMSALLREPADGGLSGRRVIVLGAGAAARTAAVTLADLSAEVVIVNRTLERASALAADVVGATAAPWSELGRYIPRAEILINATSAVHEGQALELDLSNADIDLTVVEMSYRPLLTPLLRQAESLGLRTVDGLAMLIGQAWPSFEAFFGVAAPPARVVDVRALCIQALDAAE